MLMILLTSAAILLVSYLWSRRIVEELSEELISQRIDQTEQELEKFFMPLHNGLLLFREWAKAGLLEEVEPRQIAPSLETRQMADTTSVEKLNSLFVPLLERFGQISSMMIADAEGGEYMLLRNQNHWLIRITEAERWGRQTFWMRREADGRYTEQYWKELDYDPRRRPWFQGGLKTPAGAGTHWTAPYKFFTTKAPGITASVHWREPGQPGTTRVMAFDVMLVDISRFTTALRVSENGKALVLSGDGTVVGLPRDERFGSLADLSTHVLTPVDALATPELDAAVKTWRERGIKPENAFSFQSGDDTWWAGLRAFPLGARTFWIAVVVPERDFLGEIIRQRNIVLVITGAALVISFFVAVALARGYSRPLAALAAQASRIQRLDLERGESIESGLAEVNQLADNQEQMITALQSFSRYVPFELVRELLEIGEVATIGGRLANLTVLFTDIRSFTDIAERMSPEDLTAHLADYFEAMLEILQSEHATVDKFIGDAIMAFWGAPKSDPGQARRSVNAVLRCRRRLAELNEAWAAERKPTLPTCFGLDMGPLVVGNVGAPSRLNYTVLGDTVNLASRLESLNRRYGTEALASKALKDAVGDGFCWRLVDVVAVKGKTEAVEVYEPLGATSDVSGEVLAFARAYEDAFARYRSRDFGGALERLEELARQRPHDASIALLMGICEEFRSEPPPDSWDGVTTLDTK
jgi:adenylate cyclase